MDGGKKRRRKSGGAEAPESPSFRPPSFRSSERLREAREGEGTRGCSFVHELESQERKKRRDREGEKERRVVVRIQTSLLDSLAVFDLRPVT